MKEKNKKEIKDENISETTPIELEEKNDFGGLPNGVDLRKNMGCGG
ncbi:MAG: hypothetical protein OEX22_02005 [Cyclobacteriaceae bacterium]|nr:hypothetical protein [Cyclobacteriaceae bacterium]